MPPGLEALVARAEAVHRAAQDFVARSAERRAWAQEFAALLPARLAHFRSSQEAKRSEGEELSRQLSACADTLAREPPPAETSGLAGALTAARAVHNDIESLLAGLPERTRAHHKRLALRAGEVSDRAQELSVRTEAVRSAVGEGVDRFGSALQALADETALAVEDAARALAAAAADEAARDVPGGDASHVDDDTQDLARRVSAAETRVEAATRELAMALKELGERFREAGVEARDSRRTLEPLIEDLNRRLGPLQRSVERVKSVALNLGIF